MFEKICKRIAELCTERAELLKSLQQVEFIDPQNPQQLRVWHIEGMLEVYTEEYRKCRSEMAG